MYYYFREKWYALKGLVTASRSAGLSGCYFKPGGMHVSIARIYNCEQPLPRKPRPNDYRLRSFQPPFKKSRVEPMTIAIALKFSEGILLCADTQHTYSGLMKTQGTKLSFYDFTHNGSKIAFAICGNSNYARMAVQHIASDIGSISENQTDATSLRHYIEINIRDMYDGHVRHHPYCGQPGGPEFELLVVAFTQKDSTLRLFYTFESSVIEVEERYLCIGSGMYLTNYLIKQDYKKDMSLPEIVTLASCALTGAKNHVDGCGGDSEFIKFCYDGSASEIFQPSSGISANASDPI